MSLESGIEQEQDAVAQEPVSKGLCQEGKGRERVCAEDAVSEEVRTEIKLLSLQVG